jgi:hypothetical protein
MGIFNDMLEGLTDHPGFSQIISSVIQENDFNAENESYVCFLFYCFPLRIHM